MNFKGLVLAALVAFIVIFAGGFVIHHMLLKDLYMQTAAVWRSPDDMGRRFWIIVVQNVLIAVLLAYTYSKGFEPGKGKAGQGFRFGAVMGLLLAGSMSLGSYFSLPIPKTLALGWLACGFVQYVLAGVAISLVYG